MRAERTREMDGDPTTAGSPMGSELWPSNKKAPEGAFLNRLPVITVGLGVDDAADDLARTLRCPGRARTASDRRLPR
jgi:hypothetical protein